jgi:ABC-type dipeptide/oligopeptide/nickel transport system permease subunit
VDQVERVAPARRGLWQSKAFLTGAVLAGFLVLVAALAPLLTAVAGQDYISFHPDRIDPSQMVPLGGFGGISGEHWLGVEPMNGRDLFARVVYSLRFSLGVAVGAVVVEVLLCLLVAAAVRRGNVRRLLGPALMYGALLIPLHLIFEVGIAFQGTGLRRPPAPSWGGMLADALPWYYADPAFLLVPGLLLVVTVLAFLLLADGLRRRFVAW